LFYLPDLTELASSWIFISSRSPTKPRNRHFKLKMQGWL